jgi:hypothetical protein
MTWTRKHLVVAAGILITVSNVFVLVGAVLNRSGEPDSALRLGERELLVLQPAGGRDNSGLSLQLEWRVLPAVAHGTGWYGGTGRYGSPAWLDKEKMASLGFDVSLPDEVVDTGRSFRRQLARDVFVVLEVDGSAYRESASRALAEAQRLSGLGKEESAGRGKEIVREETEVNSRLFAVDAGLDRSGLRAKYQDRSRYAIVRGRIEPAPNRANGREYEGVVEGISADAINVPLESRQAFEGAAVRENRYFAPQRRASGARFEATVAFGQRLEPWILAASKK